MADDRSDEATEKQGKAPSPSPLPERVTEAAREFGKAMKGFVTGGQSASPGDHAVPPHSPDASGEGSASDDKARGRSLSQTPPTFAQRLEELRQYLPDRNTLERVREAIEPECP